MPGTQRYVCARVWHLDYYAVGSFKELKEAEILTKKGSFIGMGGATALVEDFNKEQFIEIDIEEVKDILIGSKKATMATTHPSSSYEFLHFKKGVFHFRSGRKPFNLCDSCPVILQTKLLEHQ